MNAIRPPFLLVFLLVMQYCLSSSVRAEECDITKAAADVRGQHEYVVSAILQRHDDPLSIRVAHGVIQAESQLEAARIFTEKTKNDFPEHKIASALANKKSDLITYRQQCVADL